MTRGQGRKRIGFLVTLLVIGTGTACYFWYSRNSADLAPDSIAGFAFAIAGTVCFLLAAICYTLSRHRRRRVAGQLHGALYWHVCFALMGFALLLMHSFGNFNAKTGTYALYGMVALLVSGFVGRAFDAIMPRLIAREVDQMLTIEGEERTNNTTPIPLQSVMAQARQQVLAMQQVQRGLQRELCYRSIIVYWRILHLCLAVLSIGLIIWHLVYVAQLLLSGMFHGG